MPEETYWESYYDQTLDDGFKRIGVGKDISDISNIKEQAEEYKRRYGKNADIRVYL